MATQVNIRLDDDLVLEIDSMAKVMHLSRTEYIRMRIAQAIQNDALNMTDAIILEYTKGRISDRELEELVGKDADEIRFIVKRIRDGKRKVDDLIEKGDL